jgi:hypothetical protein
MRFCITHGRQHYPGETEDVLVLGDDLRCRESEWTVIAGDVLADVPSGEQPDDLYYTLGADDLAYLDTRPDGGLVPVKVLAIEPTDGGTDNEDAHVM